MVLGVVKLIYFTPKKELIYNLRNGLIITKSKELESIFIEMQNHCKQKNVIVGLFINILVCIQLNPLTYISKTLIH